MITDRKAAQAFQKLASMEATHIERLYEHYGQLLGEATLPSLDQLKAGSGYMEGGITMNEELLRIGTLKFLDDLEALEIALEKEYMSYDFYKRVAELVGDTKAKNLLHELAGEERTHINALLRQFDEPRGGAQQ